jgi:hypothetical protein
MKRKEFAGKHLEMQDKSVFKIALRPFSGNRKQPNEKGGGIF